MPIFRIVMLLCLIWISQPSECKNKFVINEEVCIIIDRQPASVAELAATELQYFIRKTTGYEIPIRHTLVHSNQRAIYVGTSKYTRSQFPQTSFKEQEYLIDITPQKVFLIGQDSNMSEDIGRDNNGNSPLKDRHIINYGAAIGDSTVTRKITLPSLFDAQGTCYATYDFIERFLGIRFYGPHPNNISWIENQKIKINNTKIKRTPALKYRHGTYSFDWPIMKDQYFSSTNDMQQLFLRRLRMGGIKWASNHSFTSYQDRFLKKNPNRPELFESYHPEYFAVGRDGGASERQFCYTNKGLIKQVAKDAINYFKTNKLVAEQIALGDYFAIVPLDNAAWCTCDNCQSLLSIDKQNIRGTHFNCGTSTHYIWSFINNVAKEVKKEVPNKKIAALAYHVYAYRPQNIQIEDNIAVAPCLHPRNYWSPQMKKNEIRLYKDWIKESRKSGRDIFLWNYLCFPTERGLVFQYNVFPGFNIHTVGEQIKTYYKDKIKGVFLCGIGEQLDFYITMKLYDNPHLNIDKLIEKFFHSYFGKSAIPMQKFYTKIESVYSDSKNYPQNVQTEEAQFHQTEKIAWEYLGTKHVMNELAGYISSAEQLATTETEKSRVKSWKTGVWEYMNQGYQKYNISKKNQ